MTFSWEAGEGWYENLSPVNKAVSMNSERSFQARALLEAGKGSELVALLGGQARPGFVQYCPECQRVYCKDHVAVEASWSGSWHESTNATCPLGHRREFE